MSDTAPGRGKDRGKPATSFSRQEDLATTQRENLLSHDTSGIWKCFEGDPCKALWFHSFPTAADAGRLLPAPSSTSILLPSLSGNCWDTARGRSQGHLMASGAGPSLPSEEHSRPGDHSQGQPRVQITRKLLMRQV